MSSVRKITDLGPRSHGRFETSSSVWEEIDASGAKLDRPKLPRSARPMRARRGRAGSSSPGSIAFARSAVDGALESIKGRPECRRGRRARHDRGQFRDGSIHLVGRFAIGISELDRRTRTRSESRRIWQTAGQQRRSSAAFHGSRLTCRPAIAADEGGAPRPPTSRRRALVAECFRRPGHAVSSRAEAWRAS
jgi:hypothetical protein